METPSLVVGSAMLSGGAPAREVDLHKVASEIVKASNKIGSPVKPSDSYILARVAIEACGCAVVNKGGVRCR